MRLSLLISIITPVFNESRYLPHLLESLIRQDHEEWEIVLVDDGSTDDTVVVARDWTSRDARIRLVPPNGKFGKVTAFNRAFSECRGDLVCHVGGDDVIPEGGLRARADALTGVAERAVAFGKLQFIDAHGVPVGSPVPRGPHGSQSSPGATYTRQLAELIFPVPETLPSEDIWLGNAARACSNKVITIPDVITHYRRHGLNSNPRHQPFHKMSDSISRRMAAYDLLLESTLPISESAAHEFQNRIFSERLRSSGETLRILTQSQESLIDRLALASMSNAHLWRIRQRLSHRASGWRGR